jgi:hypothetical protein
MQPIDSPSKATIAVNFPVCPDCKAFLRYIQVEFVIEIDIQERMGSEKRRRFLGTRNSHSKCNITMYIRREPLGKISNLVL